MGWLSWRRWYNQSRSPNFCLHECYGITGTLAAIGGSFFEGVIVVAAAPIVAGKALAMAGWGIAKGLKKHKQSK